MGRILFVVAMDSEAAPLRQALDIEGEPVRLHPAFPAQIWTGDVGASSVAVAINGSDPRFAVESIASQPAVTTTLHAVEYFEPSLVISGGTAGGFGSQGGQIGTVYLSDACVFHDRRVSIPGWDEYGVGNYPVADLSAVAAELGLPMGLVTTGNALDAPPVDMARMVESGAVAKDMEAAAVAWVCERLGVPFAALKSITDLVDHPEETASQFERNLATATEKLAAAATSLVSLLS